MNTETITLARLAEEARSFLYRGDRKADGIGPVLLPKDNSPDWLKSMCFAAHDAGHILPDDWRYEFIGDALDLIADREDLEDPDDLREAFEEWFDGAYIYTAEQTAWLASRADRYSYCDDAADEYGGKPDTLQRIALGMLAEAREVFESVLSSLAARIEDLEDDD